jgi:hypothetical protein|tara:strand:- start:289 stop:591 length:303 start_codon:yes stop_codon:yes gene_type:complete
VLRDKKWLAVVRRKLPCVVCLQSPCDPAHIRIGFNGVGIKPGDDKVLPLCRIHHSEQHHIGEKTFWKRLGINPLDLSERIYNQPSSKAALIIKQEWFKNK